jgi:hypothetical protein
LKRKLDHVAILHDVVLALHAGLALGARHGHRPGLDQVVGRDDLGLDEALLEVGVDDTGAGFFRARGEVGLQAEVSKSRT